MTRAKLLLIGLPFLAGLACLSYVAAMNQAGYCLAEGRYVSEQEKIAAIVADVLQHYPPPVVTKQVDARGWSHTPPTRPIRYRDVADFLAQNPGCCPYSDTRKELEGSGPSRMEKLTGSVAGFVGLNYAVRYLDDDNTLKVVRVNTFAAVSNCGKPARKWYPGEHYFEFHPL